MVHSTTVTRSTVQHLRFGFSLYLAPVYLFALTQAREIDSLRAVAIFVLLHVFLYPASNGYNSYYDRDEGSIGGLERPPPVDLSLLRAANVLDAVALAGGLLLDWRVGALLAAYIAASRAYSHPRIRLKRRPWAGWFSVSLFQGAGSFLATAIGVAPAAPLAELALPAALSSLIVGASYPLTQIYQHSEDGRRGDQTLSRLLGVRGTFLFSGALFAAADLGMVHYLAQAQERPFSAWLFQVALAPTVFLFAYWMHGAWTDPSRADFRSTMRMNRVSALSTAGFFLIERALR